MVYRPLVRLLKVKNEGFGIENTAASGGVHHVAIGVVVSRCLACGECGRVDGCVGGFGVVTRHDHRDGGRV